MSICAACRTEIWRWRDTTPAMLRPGIRFHSHASYDDTPAGMRTNRSSRWQDWRDLVVRQSKLITEQCAAQHQPGQQALFDLQVVA